MCRLFSCSSNSIEKGRESSPENLLGPALVKQTPSPLYSPDKGEVLLMGPFYFLLEQPCLFLELRVLETA